MGCGTFQFLDEMAALGFACTLDEIGNDTCQACDGCRIITNRSGDIIHVEGTPASSWLVVSWRRLQEGTKAHFDDRDMVRNVLATLEAETLEVNLQDEGSNA